MFLALLFMLNHLFRQRVVRLRDLAAGQTQKEIAIARQISPETVKKRLERARIALDARNAVHAVAIATKRGLILNDLPINFEK